MKTVFANHELAHVWASQSQSHGRNSGDTFYFDKETIYSYGSHFPIARFITPDVVLLNSSTYSSSTSQHQSNVRGAIRHHTIFEVPLLHQGMNRRGGQSFHESNLSYLRDMIFKEKGKSLRAIKFSSEHHGQAMSYLDTLRKYRKLFQIHLTGKQKRHWLKFIKTPVYNEVEQEKIEAKTTRSKELGAIRQTRWKKKNEKLLAEYLEKVALWIEGKEVKLPYVGGVDNFTLCYLRIKGDQVETTWGATVPIIGARKLYRAIQSGVSVVGQKIGLYTVSRITEDALIVGCHQIPLIEVNRIGDLLEKETT